MFVERLKRRTYTPLHANAFFWRTYDQQQIDLVEEREDKLFGYEVQWSATNLVRPPKSWTEAYSNAEYTVITPNNYLDFVLPD